MECFGVLRCFDSIIRVFPGLCLYQVLFSQTVSGKSEVIWSWKIHLERWHGYWDCCFLFSQVFEKFCKNYVWQSRINYCAKEISPVSYVPPLPTQNIPSFDDVILDWCCPRGNTCMSPLTRILHAVTQVRALRAAGWAKTDQAACFEFCNDPDWGKKIKLSAYRWESKLDVVQTCLCTLQLFCCINLCKVFLEGESGRGVEKVMTCYFLILRTCSVLNGNNWKWRGYSGVMRFN